MQKLVRFTLLVVLLAGSLLVAPAPARAQSDLPVPGACVRGANLPGGAWSLFCIPTSGWNGDLVVFAHGYVAFNEPIDFYNLTLADGTYLPDLVQRLGFAFATTSYRQNGLSILQGVDDIVELVAAFPNAAGGQTPNRTYLTGASEGGIVTALAVERHPELFSGGLAACGPIGDFKKQTDYFGDLRVLFDYFYPNVLPPSPIAIPDELIENWDSSYRLDVESALRANPSATRQLIRTAQAPIDLFNPETQISTPLDVLWYNVFATNDAATKLGGNPYGNRGRWYWGSLNDLRLNRQVQRFDASPVALAALNDYQTSGNVTIPLVTIHTTGDDVIPFWHEILYHAKVHTSGRGSVIQIPIFRYGHCNFKAVEVLGAFALVVLQSTGEQLDVPLHYDVDQVAKDFRRAQDLQPAMPDTQ